MDNQIIRTETRPLRYGLDVFLTCIVWMLFISLSALSLMKFFNPDVLGENVFHRLKVYFYFSCLNAVGLIIWAVYNRIRFRKERRKNSPRTPLPNLLASLGVDPDMYMEMQKAQRMIVTHNDHGEIEKVSRL
ncbi:poly-beta-1,6-N-acetyl-D-glucosamine biosynthesis protein PgaD [Enterobacter sp. ENT03]|uniref:poly-beta-1,6-N-acetyl-D-glucosamine biosynthesis protein PgaD n=1 Tax=Enterobacter sp. ENT03 TaxID=2854780 RepID=UPI001C44D354|nr:poly-beta-1,6-N-acetyl-D-glucosamine biosynthesis protein PgaD [Enterobacter sp. ENT03]MBV7405198.1 poly-beta-1,6-N-acetyl-D-glucosamine biosynthesis protein PgaD [Enterobacter sp. ENT03]